MKLFIIHWELNSISEDNIVIYGFGYSEDHTQVRLAITDFVPYKYSRMIHKDFSYKSEQKYVLREYDKGIQKLYKHYFTNAQEYNLFILFIIYYLLFIIYYLLFIIYYLLFIIYYLLFIIYYLLFIIQLFIIYYLIIQLFNYLFIH